MDHKDIKRDKITTKEDISSPSAAASAVDSEDSKNDEDEDCEERQGGGDDDESKSSEADRPPSHSISLLARRLHTHLARKPEGETDDEAEQQRFHEQFQQQLQQQQQQQLQQLQRSNGFGSGHTGDNDTRLMLVNNPSTLRPWRRQQRNFPGYSERFVQASGGNVPPLRGSLAAMLSDSLNDGSDNDNISDGGASGGNTEDDTLATMMLLDGAAGGSGAIAGSMIAADNARVRADEARQRANELMDRGSVRNSIPTDYATGPNGETHLTVERQPSWSRRIPIPSSSRVSETLSSNSTSSFGGVMGNEGVIGGAVGPYGSRNVHLLSRVEGQASDREYAVTQNTSGTFTISARRTTNSAVG